MISRIRKYTNTVWRFQEDVNEGFSSLDHDYQNKQVEYTVLRFSEDVNEQAKVSHDYQKITTISKQSNTALRFQEDVNEYATALHDYTMTTTNSKYSNTALRFQDVHEYCNSLT